MTDSSDFESDAGASPSVCSEGSAASSSRSSSPALKIVCESPTTVTPKKRNSINGSGNQVLGGGVPTPGTSSVSGMFSPVVAERKSSRKKQAVSSNVSNKPKKIDTALGTETMIIKTPTRPLPLRKRKLSSKCSPEPGEKPVPKEDDTKLSPETKRQRNKRRRTRSERNLLAGKSASPIKKVQEVVAVAVAEGEEAVALDAEIDRVLEEKAIKNNLSATNVKSIIRHVITNNMVQKMIMSAMKKKAENADAGGSSDEDGILEPKMTRAKIKELMGTKIQLWPIVDSPVKINKVPVSETHMLIHNDLPEDSSGEEYVPRGADISEMTHVTTDDEASSVMSFSSDTGSPSSKKQGVSTRRSLQTGVKSPFNDSMFKTPPPRPKSEKKDQVESAISLRTRSKHPLNDTPLEDLERLFIPPDITKDMYDFSLEETDHKEYMVFLQNFLYSKNDLNEHDDDADADADPEYNVMEDDEDLHDREELRMDRAVKVPKKELTELIAELFEPGLNSGDDMEDHDLASLTGITPLTIHPNEQNLIDSGQGSLLDISGHNTSLNIDCGNSSGSLGALNISGGGELPKVEVGVDGGGSKNNTTQPNYVPQILIHEINGNLGATTPDPAVTKIEVVLQSANDVSTKPAESAKITPPPENIGPPLFGENDLQFLQQQIRQHIQLLCQSYVLTVSTEDTTLKGIAKTAKGMILELKNFSDLNGSESSFSVCNLVHAWNLVNFWPHKFLQQSPIKKKILEEKYISEVGGAEGKAGKLNYFPRHVVKVITENSAFLYNHLLPECYLQDNHQNRCSFNYWEDALLVNALEDLKEINSKLSAKQLAEAISETLLIVHPVSQVYHRLRNLRKSNLSSKNCDPEIVKYFKEGKVPEPDRTVIEIQPSNLEPLIQRDRRGVSTQWMALLQLIEESSTFKWEENLSKDPVTKSLGQKWSKNRVKKNAKPCEPLTMPPPPLDDIFLPTIDRVFPNGTLELDTSKPDMEAFPVLNSSGRPGAIIYIPKYALNAEGANPFKSPSKGTVPRDREGGRQPLADFNGNDQHRVGEEAGLEAQQPYDSTASTVNILGLQQLIRTARTPLKNLILSPTKVYSPVRVGYSVVQPEFHKVGKPFDLPEDIKSKQFEANDIIDLRTLQTPLKQQVLQSALGEPPTTQIQESDSPTKSAGDVKSVNEEQINNDAFDASSSSEGSCNVIFEGTEYELSDGYDDESVGTEAPPEIVTLLTSDEEDDVKPVNVDVKHVSMDGSYDLPPPPNDGDGKTTKGDGNSKKTEAGSSNNSKQTTSSTNSSSTAISARKSCGAGGKGDDSDDDGERKSNRKRNLPKGCKDDVPMKEEEKVPEKQAKSSNSNSQPNKKPQNLPGPSSAMMMPAPSVSTPKPPTTPQQSVNASNGAGTSKSQKKAKRSPGNQGSSRRSSKYNVTSTEKMLQEDTNDFDEVADAYMEAYLAKVQSTTEAKHSGVYTTFVQMLLDAGTGPVNQTELHAKVKVLFKEYPDLLREFESFLDPTLDQVVDETNQMLGSTAHEETVAQIKFIQQLEKFTENCPHLKAKVMNKVKSLKENGCLTDKEVATSLEPFFVGNPVIMDAFKCLFPSVYRPQSVSAAIDFEEIELDMEDPPKDGNDETMKYEIVKLPEETNVLATSTCPCVCHTKTSDPAFANRSKHCRKCSLKFQDGKIYIHNGKVMRPVSVELKKF